MKKRQGKRHTPEQIIRKLREADTMLAADKTIGQVVQALEISEQTFHRWRVAIQRYPVVCDLSSGEIRFDNFEGRWGEQKHLDQFMQAYARLEARKRGHSVTETQLTDGSIKLTIQVNGGAA